MQPSGSEGGLTFQELEMEMHTLIQQPNFRNNIEENIQDSNNQETFFREKQVQKMTFCEFALVSFHLEICYKYFVHLVMGIKKDKLFF